MKRAFAIFIVALLAIGMIGLFFVPLLQGTGAVSQTPAPTYTVSTSSVPANTITTSTNTTFSNSSPGLPNLAQ